MWIESIFLASVAILSVTWLYGIRAYDALTKLRKHQHHPLFNTGHASIVALTIDDAPWRFRPLGGESDVLSMGSSVKEIGAVLEQHGCSATLMVIGSYVEEASAEIIQTLRRLCGNGTIEYANHGYSNAEHARLPIGELETELVETERVVRSRLLQDDDGGGCPAMTRFYRPGCGRFHSDMLECAAARGYRTVLGDVYSFDPHVPIALLHLIHIMITVRPGSIVILHDRPWTPALLRWLLPLLKWRGYRVEMLSKAMQRTEGQ